LATILTTYPMASKHQQSKRRLGVRKHGPGQRKLGRVGRESKFEQTDTTTLIADIARGVPVVVACAAQGIHKDTFYVWLDERPVFAQSLAAEKQRVILEALTAVRSGSKENDWRGYAWFLERVYRDHFAPPDQAALAFTQNNFTISFEKARQIEETRAKLLPEVHAMLGLTNGQTNGSEPRT
jgi:hypothetical protein